MIENARSDLERGSNTVFIEFWDDLIEGILLVIQNATGFDDLPWGVTRLERSEVVGAAPAHPGEPGTILSLRFPRSIAW